MEQFHVSYQKDGVTEAALSLFFPSSKPLHLGLPQNIMAVFDPLHISVLSLPSKQTRSLANPSSPSLWGHWTTSSVQIDYLQHQDLGFSFKIFHDG